MPKTKTTLSKFARNAQKAFREAVRDAVDRSHRLGVPVAIWKNGKVVLIPPPARFARSRKRVA